MSLLGGSVVRARYTPSMTQTPHSCEGEPWVGQAILHVDLDAFFASVEQLDHPEWRGKPVIVGGDPGRRGVVSTCSYEARAFGVRSAMSSTRAAQLCPDAIWTHGSFERYHEVSRAVRAIFAEETPLVQPVSIDEAYLDVTPGRYATEHPIAIARRIRARVAELGITCSVGVSAIKSVAKIASDVDKPDGLTVVCPGEEAAFLAPMRLRAMPGLGPKTAERLAVLGVHSLGELAELDDRSAVDALGPHGVSLVHRARGEDSRSVHENAGAKSVSNERTFATDVRSPAEVDGALASLAAKVGRRLRKAGLAGRTVTVKLRFSDFTTRTVQRTLASATADEAVFGPVARELIRSAWAPGIGLRLLGVGLSGFEDRAAQLGLFDAEAAGHVTDASGVASLASSAGAARGPVHPHDSEERARLVRGLDAVREKFGDTAVRTGREMVARRPSTGTAPGQIRDDTEVEDLDE
jgi:DNA polymerase IV